MNSICNNFKDTKLKYVCFSKATQLSQNQLLDEGLYPVYGASGIVGYLNKFEEKKPYLGIIKDGAGVGRINKYSRFSSLLGTLSYILPNENIDIDWLLYTIQSLNLSGSIDKTTIPHIYFSEYGNKKIKLVPFDIQTRIASFLDSKCAEIDSITADIQKEIDLLQEYRKSVITEAVTKGFDPNVEMKDSGIEWIGEIPEGWNSIPFKYVLKERAQKNDPIISTERLSLSIGAGVTLYADKTTNLDRFKDDFTQYKIAHQGDLVMNSMNMIVGATGLSNYFGCISPAYYTFFDDEYDHVTAKFCEYLFLTPLLLGVLHKLGKGIMFIERGEGKVNTCRLKVSRIDLGRIKLPIPPVPEQRLIVEYLKNKCSEIDSIIEAKQKQLDTLAEYRKSLIYEYVTSKKEVSLC